MLEHFSPPGRRKAIPVHVVTERGFEAWRDGQPERQRRWLAATEFRPTSGALCLLPADDGALAAAVFIRSKERGPWPFAGASSRLPSGCYRFEGVDAADADDAALGWALGGYGFDRYRKRTRTAPSLIWPTGADRPRVSQLATALGLGRDLVNQPAADLGPAELALAAQRVARKHRAKCAVVAGARLAKEYPAIHAVGKGSAQRPCLIDLRYGAARAPRLTLVGKGVCFDAGGLDLKPSHAMKLMKKDMAGAAIVLGLADALMAARLPVRLRVLIPAVENAISGTAMHPLDVIRTRSGTTVEVGNTDAEGRLVLCDALTEAVREEPDLVIDVATLTGAARVALGTDLPALFTRDDELADQLLGHGRERGEPLWRLPLHDGYRRTLDSKVADLSNIANTGFGGAITAALFLSHFVGRKTRWIHLDTMGWQSEARPGRPVGGDVSPMLALYRFLLARYGKSAPEPARPRRATRR